MIEAYNNERKGEGFKWEYDDYKKKKL